MGPQVQFKRGFIVYSDGNEKNVIVSPHSGPALESSTSRDDNSETVASLCWGKIGGKLIIGNMPRHRLLGIDFNRDIPSLDLALKYYKHFINRDLEKINYFKSRYGWVAIDEKDYYNRLKIYQDFWAEVGKGQKIVLVHRAFTKMRNVPSIIDIVTFGKDGVKQDKIKGIVDEVNLKYYNFLKKIEDDYKQAILFETKRELLNVIDKNGNIVNINSSLKKDLKKMELYCSKEKLIKLKNDFTPQNFLDCVQDSLRNIPFLRITIQKVFEGDLAYAPKRKLFPRKDKTIIEVEPCRFMNFWHPQITAEILYDVLKMLEN